MRHLAPIFAACSILVCWSSSQAQQRYGWSVSGSEVDPFENTGSISVGGTANIYLWYVCNSPDGLAAADFSAVVNPSGAVTVLAFNTDNGFLNAGSATDLLLAVGGCPNGPWVAGSWLITPNSPGWEFCLGGNQLSVDCQINPVAWSSETHGFANGSVAITCGDGICPTSIDTSSWGMIKSFYK